MGFTAQGSTGSQPLVEEIRKRIEQSPCNTLSFHDYMDMCLYHPEWGYYSRPTVKIGKDGDFYTSSGVGTIMGEMLAGFIADWFKKGQGSQVPQIPYHVVEWGAGSGRLAAQILDHLAQAHPDCYNHVHYALIDHSAYHRQMQEDLLGLHSEKVSISSGEEWLGSGPREAFILSNELLDAFPVHRVRMIDGRLHEIHVAWDGRGGYFHETLVPAENGRLADYLQQHRASLAEGQTAEINLHADEWIGTIGKRIQAGVLLTIDYGDTADEIYGDHRMAGTLMCYHQHLAHDDPYRWIGEQDLTSHVNFSACISAGQKVGFTDWTLRTQRQFLIDCGILTKLQDDPGGDPFGPVARKNRSIRQLLWSDRMSELFKVLVQHKKGV